MNFVLVYISQYISNKMNRIVFLFLGGGICGVEKRILYFFYPTEISIQLSFWSEINPTQLQAWTFKLISNSRSHVSTILHYRSKFDPPCSLITMKEIVLFLLLVSKMTLLAQYHSLYCYIYTQTTPQAAHFLMDRVYLQPGLEEFSFNPIRVN